MRVNVVENFRGRDGLYRDPWCFCNICDGLSEVYVRVTCSVGYGTSINICKGCLTNMIGAIDGSYRGHIKKSAAIAQ